MLGDLDRPAQLRLIGHTVLRIAVVLALIVTAYAISPTGSASRFSIPVRVTLAVAIILLSTVLALRSVVRARYPVLRAAETIAALVSLLEIGFASIYLSISAATAGAFSEPLGHRSAFYFALTTATTVGFGDITPQTDSARIAVMFQMVGNVVVIGAVTRILINTAKRRRSGRDQVTKRRHLVR